MAGPRPHSMSQSPVGGGRALGAGSGIWAGRSPEVPMCQQLREPREPLVEGSPGLIWTEFWVLTFLSARLPPSASHPVTTWAEDSRATVPALGQVSLLPPGSEMHSNRRWDPSFHVLRSPWGKT